MSDRQIDRVFDIMESGGIGEALFEAPDLSFDWHGEVVLKLLGYQAVSKVLKVMRVPFRSAII